MRQYQEALTDIRNLEAEAEEIESMAMSMTSHPEMVSVKCGKDKDGKDKFEEQVMDQVQSSSRKDRMADLATRVADLELEIMGLRSQALGKLKLVEEVIAAVDNRDYRQLLHRRYIEGNNWKQISTAMGYSCQHIYRKHGWALQKVREILKVESNCE